MIILGIDPGTTQIGFGIIRNEGNHFEALDYGIIKNQKTVMSVGEMRGVIMLTLANHNLTVLEFTPMQVKQTVSGHGGADKDQVQRMDRLILGVKTEIKPDDAADE